MKTGMQWTPFGRIGGNLDAIPRANLDYRTRTAQDRPSSFEHQVLEARREAIADERAPEARTDNPTTQTTKSEGHDETATPEPSEPKTAHRTTEGRTEAAQVTPTGDEGRASSTSPERTQPATREFLEPAPAISTPVATPAAIAAKAPVNFAPPTPTAIAGASSATAVVDGRGVQQAAASSPKNATANTAPVRQTMPAVLTEEQHRALIRRIALAATETGGEMRMLLEPQNLGSLGVRLRLNGTELQLELRADNREVVALLDRDMSRLQLELRNQGLDVQDIDIGMSDRNEQRRAQHEFENGGRTFQGNQDADGTGSANTATGEHLELDSVEISITPEEQLARAVLDTLA